MNAHPAASAGDMNLLADDAFRLAVRGWIEANYPPDLRFPQRRLHWRDNRVWYDKLAAKGWLCPGWPPEWGGMGLAAGKQLIMIEELERHGCARVSDMGTLMLGPLLIKYGSEEQKRFFLPRIISGEHVWAQGYSEPDAGSDLAAVRTEAVLDGDEWVVGGQKTWITFANDANWIFVLARTSKAAKKQQGISFLLIPMDLPGITVRPILNLDRHDEFCEVFFDRVRVPRGNLVGEIDKGWSMAKALLGFERVAIGSPKLSSLGLSRLKLLAQRAGLWGDPVFADTYTRLRLDLADLKALYESFVDRLRRGEPVGVDVSMLKLFQSELYQRITEVMLEVAGEEAGLLAPLDADRGLNPSGQFLQARPTTIFGGSSEIQRNILAKSVLELPDPPRRTA
ncbi:MAG: acyl-CoA dehydrogenase family protein [Rhizobiales bacterium]|nr:acyl-CoA dehydrogenase family protein [Hyphomicrobiales bacterium]